MQKQINKIEISDEVCKVIADLEKAAEMVRQLSEGYFNLGNINKNAIKSIKDEHMVCLAYDYKVNKIIFDIACDYIFRSLEKMKELEASISIDRGY